ncbi:MAG: periplasmic heavy metal sensor [Candidatus Omnitrophica bacterium]|nr:periplasmic heavy metal sensor [Candidatus Omnitrophota bacterium]
MKKLLTGLLGVFMFLSFASAPSAFSQPSEKGMGMKGEFRENFKEKYKERKEARFEEMKEDLGLTDDQVTRLKEHKQANRKHKKEFWGELKSKKDLLKEALQKDELNRDEIQKIHSEIKVMKNQMEDDRLESILEVREILTPEQFQKFHEITDKERKHYKNKWKSKSPGPEAEQE